MSLNSMTDNAIRDYLVSQSNTTGRVFSSGAAPGAPTAAEANAAAALDNDSANKVVDAIVGYIPTEMLATFVAACAIAGTLKWDVQTLYFIWVVLTPFVTLVIAYSKLASLGTPWPPLGSPWFLQQIYLAIVAMLAFIVWGLSVPTNTVLKDAGPAFAGFAATLLSPVLSILQPIVNRIIGVEKKP